MGDEGANALARAMKANETLQSLFLLYTTASNVCGR